MKVITRIVVLIMMAIPYGGMAQSKESLVDVGGYQLHFTIIPGKGTPILFESGGGNDGSIWQGITPTIAEITEATIICYDRAGLGKSTIDSTQIGIENEIQGLETALKQLGYNKDIILVCHSLGGFYNTIYAARHPRQVKGIVFIDANLASFFTEEQFEQMKASLQFRNTVEAVRNNPLPPHIPVIDIVAERMFEGTPNADRWKKCHADFVSGSLNRKGIMAEETGHYVFLSNRQLAINAIVTMYANQANPAEKGNILERGYAQSLIAANNDRRDLLRYQHSEAGLNDWGYTLLQRHETEKALEVFKLNVSLYPESDNVYDSLADCYQTMGNKEAAILNYKKVLELNPQKASAQKALEKLSAQ